MIRSFQNIKGTQIYAIDDEEFGNLKDVYFDDTSWKVQYFVVELGQWFTGKEVLVPPEVVFPFDGNLLRVSMTKAELRSCPHAETAIPVSLQQRYQQRSLFEFASSAGRLSSGGPFIVPPMSKEFLDVSAIDPHLRSCRNITGYTIIATDGEIGPVQDYLIDDSSWVLRFIIGHNALSTNQKGSMAALFDPQLVDEIEWSLSSVKICIKRDDVKKLPGYDPLRHPDIAYGKLEQDIRSEKYHE